MHFLMSLSFPLAFKIPRKVDWNFQWNHWSVQCCYKSLLRLSRFDAFQCWELWRIPTSLGLVHWVLKSLTKTFFTTLLLIRTDEQLPDHSDIQNPQKSMLPLDSILLLSMPSYFFFFVLLFHPISWIRSSNLASLSSEWELRTKFENVIL